MKVIVQLVRHTFHRFKIALGHLNGTGRLYATMLSMQSIQICGQHLLHDCIQHPLRAYVQEHLELGSAVRGSRREMRVQMSLS